MTPPQKVPSNYKVALLTIKEYGQLCCRLGKLKENKILCGIFPKQIKEDIRRTEIDIRVCFNDIKILLEDKNVITTDHK